MPTVDVAALRNVFDSGRTRSLEWRLKQLQGIVEFTVLAREELTNAFAEDIGRNKELTEFAEFNLIEGEARWMSKHLRQWMKKKPVSSTLPFLLYRKYTIHEPLGVVLVISAWNYPILISLIPVIGALAAGNCVVLKPSELLPNVAKVFEEFLPKYVDAECLSVLNGGPEVTSEFLKTQRVDQITFTGSDRVGRLVMSAAARNLTPVLLECGGKSPCIVLGDCDLMNAAKTIIHYKMMNAAQTCIAPDYVLVESRVKDEFAKCLKRVLNDNYSAESLKSNMSYAKIVNRQHFNRLLKYIECDQCEVYGGESDPDSLLIAPTLLIDVSDDHPAMNEEIFGPILPIQEVPDLSTAIDKVNSRPKPLAVYLFTSSSEAISMVSSRTSSGALSVNECIIHHLVYGLPFGGVGDSGIGKLHGHYSFQAYSNEKAVLIKAGRFAALGDYLICPPYAVETLKRLRGISCCMWKVPTGTQISSYSVQLLLLATAILAGAAVTYSRRSTVS